MKEYRLESRFQVSPKTLETVREYCTPAGRDTWITRTESLRVHNLRGVPAKKVDVLLPDCVPDPLVCEVGRKTGCYDNAQRRRITFRSWPHVCAVGREPDRDFKFPGLGSLRIDECSDGLEVVARWTGGMWAMLFPVIHFTVDERTDFTSVFMAEWDANYASLVPEHEAIVAGQIFADLDVVRSARDIIAVRRMAGNMLADAAVRQGWVKTTFAGRKAMGLGAESTVWQRRDGLVSRLVAAGRDASAASVAECVPTGCCPLCHGLAEQCHCGR